MLLNLRVFLWRNHRRRLPVGNLFVDIPNVVCAVSPDDRKLFVGLTFTGLTFTGLASERLIEQRLDLRSVVDSVVCERHGGYQTGVAIDPEVEEFAPRAPLLFPVGTLFPLPQGCWFGYRRRRGCRFDTSKVRLEGPNACGSPTARLDFNTSKVRLEVCAQNRPLSYG